MERRLILPLTASPKRIARSTAPRFSTGNTPGSAMSTALACVFGAAPNAVEAPEKIFDAVESCACVSRPTTTSHPSRAPAPVAAAPPPGALTRLPLRMAGLRSRRAASPYLRRARGAVERRRAVPRRSLRPLGGQRARTWGERGGRLVPVRRLLETVRDLEDPRLGEVVALELQADREPAAVEPAGNRQRRCAGQVRGDREDVVQVHLDRVVGLRAELERRRGRRRAHDHVAARPRVAEALRDE